MKLLITLSLFILTIVGCNLNVHNQNLQVTESKDPVQNFAIDSKNDTVIEGAKGTVIVCPKGCFRNSAGEIVTTNVNVVLTEALSLEDMLLSNLTTTSNGQSLETDGMIHISATANGENLTINKDNPIHIEIPTRHKKAGMFVYKGIRDVKGNINWIDPQKIDNFLTTVNLDLLDFLPEGFKATVENGMPYKKYTIATKKLTDSLYYSLSASNGSELVKGLVSTDLNEPYYNEDKKVVNGKYTKKSYQTSPDSYETDIADSINYNEEGIDPAIIKVIKSKKYQHTFLATKEFEARLQVIFKTCNNVILELYIKNLNKNLYEVDSMATLIESQYTQQFHDFYLEKCTNVKDADKNTLLLSGYYEKQLAIIKSQLEERNNQLEKQLTKKNNEIEKVVDNYRKLLWKREKYRMNRYGFNYADTGWVNIDRGIIPKDFGMTGLQVTIQNGDQYDHVYTYVVYTGIKSIYRLNTDDTKLFYVGNNEEKKMLMPDAMLSTVIVIAYKDEQSFLATREFTTGIDEQFSLALQSVTKEQIKVTISSYDKYAKENQIGEDMKYMDQFYVEKQRQKVLLKESEFIGRLWSVAHPCAMDTTEMAIK